jgi:hypothetical protein
MHWYFQIFLILLFLPIKLFALTLTSSNASYINTQTSPNLYYFPVKANGVDTTNSDCTASLSYYENTIQAPIDPASATSVFKFSLSPTKELSEINGGSEPTQNDDLVVRVAVDSDASAIDIKSLDGSSVVSSTEIAYGTVERTTSIGVYLKPGTSNGFCDKHKIVNSNIDNCQHPQNNAPNPLKVKIGIGKKSIPFDSNSDYQTIYIYPVNCPVLNSSNPSQPLNLNLVATPIDGKVKLSNYTSTPSSPISLQGVFVFSQIASISQFPTASSYYQKASSSSVGPSDIIFDGLTNDTQYCFSLSYYNLGGFLSIPYPSSSGTAVCATPSQIDGFLNQSSCFIATAAYGSEEANEVVYLRRFRNQVLLKNPIGVQFVKFYYKVSPKLADFIRKHPALKPLVRFTLKPLIYLSKKTTKDESR